MEDQGVEEVQRLNALLSMESSPLGKAMLVMLAQPWNVETSMLVTPAGMLLILRFLLQPANAFFPMDVIPLGSAVSANS